MLINDIKTQLRNRANSFDFFRQVALLRRNVNYIGFGMIAFLYSHCSLDVAKELRSPRLKTPIFSSLQRE